MRLEIVVKDPPYWVKKFLEISMNHILEFFLCFGGHAENIQGIVVEENNG